MAMAVGRRGLGGRAVRMVLRGVVSVVVAVLALACGTGGAQMRSQGGGSGNPVVNQVLAPLPPDDDAPEVAEQSKSMDYFVRRERFVSQKAGRGEGVTVDEGGFMSIGQMDVRLSLKEWVSKRAVRVQVTVTNRSDLPEVFAMDDPTGPRIVNRDFDNIFNEPLPQQPSYLTYGVAPYRVGLSWALEFWERSPGRLCPASWKFWNRGAFDGILRQVVPGASWTFTVQVMLPPTVDHLNSRGGEAFANTLWLRVQLPFLDPESAQRYKHSFAHMARKTTLAVSNWLPLRVPQ